MPHGSGNGALLRITKCEFKDAIDACPLFLLNPKLSVAACVPSLGTISRGGSGWYAPCIALRMDTMLTAPGLTLLFLGVVVGLGTAFVWLLWEIEQMSKPPRNSDRFG